MKKHCIFCGIALLCMTGVLCGAEAVEGIITASWLRARIFPELKSPVVTKLPRGKKVMIHKRHGLWLEIVAPDTTPVFASAVHISGNKVLRDLHLRTAAHSGAPVIARVKKGTLLKAVTEPDRYGWVQVAPSADMRLYVVETYVNYDRDKVPVAKKGEMPQAAPAPAPKAVPAPEKKAAAAPVKKVAAAPAPKAVPAPEKKAAAAPVKKAVPAPAPKAVPAPEKKAVAAPVKKAAPAPAPKAVPAPEKKAAAAPVKKAAPAPEKKAAAAPVPKAGVNIELTSERKQELLNIGAEINDPELYAQSGILVAVPKPGGDCTKYALAGADNTNKGFLFAAGAVKLEALVGKTVSVKGMAFRIPKWKSPVVAVTEAIADGEKK